jgi:CheY-like chemotaxis protein
MNLVVNACESMPDGGLLRVETSRRDLGRPLRGFTTIPEGQYVVLRVSDTGCGIASEQMSRIFEPFYTTKTMGHSGTGLGMAVVWATVQDHQGYVDIRSREGEGTTFELYFPALETSSVEERRSEAPPVMRGRGERVLVVDDLKEQRELASLILTRLGYAVDSVSSGAEALAHLEANQPDVLVLDMILEGGIDGLETYRRALAIRPGQRAIIVSGFAESKRVEEALSLGASGYLSKPYLVQELGATLRAALDAGPAAVADATEAVAPS